MHTFSNSDDFIDSRDIIKRIDDLRDERDSHNADAEEDPRMVSWASANPEEAEELATLESLADEASGSPDWQYGATLIHYSCFKDYAIELADDTGAINTDASWPNTCIDWDRAADELRQDYFSVDFNGIEYLIRA